jgi:hypothetical protein
MKVFAYVLLAVVTGTSSASAVIEQCRFIQSKVDREACYQRQEKALAARRKPVIVDEASKKSLDDLRIEHDRVGKSLRSICRGC